MNQDGTFSTMGILLTGFGLLGTVALFVLLVWMAKEKRGLPTVQIVGLSVALIGFLFLTAMGSHVRVISSISSGVADDK